MGDTYGTENICIEYRMRWIEALKKWNMGSAKWCIPKKGSAEYDEVKEIMGEKKESAPKMKKPAVAPPKMKKPAVAPPKMKKPAVAPSKKKTIKSMAEELDVPVSVMSDATKDYYKRVSSSRPADRKILMDNMPDHLRKGFEAYEKKKSEPKVKPNANDIPVAELAQYHNMIAKRNRPGIKYYEDKYPFLKKH
jgi:hypothetical protein